MPGWTYDVLKEYRSGGDFTPTDPLDSNDAVHSEFSVDPHWLICVVRLGVPVSFSRQKLASITTTAEGGRLRAANLLILSDCTALNVQNRKENHTKSLTASLLGQGINYLTEILPGDWIFAWIVNRRSDLLDLLARVQKMDPLNPCNNFKDGLKFVGRAHSIRRRQTVNPDNGLKAVSYSLQAVAFSELDSNFFYDNNLGEADLLNNNFGTWLARLGISVQDIFQFTNGHPEDGNVNTLIRTFLDLIVGKGIPEIINPKTGEPRLRALTGGSTRKEDDAPYAYLVPRACGALLGRTKASKKGGILSYADLLDLLQGLQHYEDPGFLPSPLNQQSENRLITGQKMLGTFLPVMPEMVNRPLWQILQQFQNPAINEMFTCLRVNPAGRVVPTLVVRQIPFTTDAFTGGARAPLAGPPNPDGSLPILEVDIDHTKFFDLPRWRIGASMVLEQDLGRSDATRHNFVHVYGQDAVNGQNMSITHQLVENPPMRDDLDIQRSGLRTYMTTVACSVRDQVGKAPARWISLISDWLMGSHLTFNGTVTTIGISAPICEGDNLEWSGLVMHIEGVDHACRIDPSSGRKSFRTTLQLTNGMPIVPRTFDQETPTYPGLSASDPEGTAHAPAETREDLYEKETAIPDSSTVDLADLAGQGTDRRVAPEEDN